jgi:hypothetical protein
VKEQVTGLGRVDVEHEGPRCLAEARPPFWGIDWPSISTPCQETRRSGRFCVSSEKRLRTDILASPTFTPTTCTSPPLPPPAPPGNRNIRSAGSPRLTSPRHRVSPRTPGSWPPNCSRSPRGNPAPSSAGRLSSSYVCADIWSISLEGRGVTVGRIVLLACV